MHKGSLSFKLVGLATFLTYSGYNSILAITLSLDLTSLSRQITVPLRVFWTFIMLIYLFNWWGSKPNKNIYIVFFSFWLLYFIKVLYHDYSGFPLHHNWIEYIFYSVVYCIVPFLMFSRVNFFRFNRILINALIHSGFLFGLLSIFLYKDALIMQVGRLSMLRYVNEEYLTIGPHALSYSGSITLILCLFKLFYQQTGFFHKVYLFFGVFLSLIMFYLGASRGALLAIIACLLVMLYYSKGKLKRRFFYIILLGVPLIFLGADQTGSAIFKRTSNTFNTTEDSPFPRKILWENAVNEFCQYPIFGRRIEIGFYPHNFILEVLMSTGIVGLILFGLVIWMGFKRANKFSMEDKNTIWVYLVFIQGLVQNFFSGGIYFAVLIFFPLGLIFSIHKSNYLYARHGVKAHS